jgi:hypothetical protein
MIAPPQPNMNVAAQQGQGDMNDPRVHEARRVVYELMKETGLLPEQLKQLGQAAEMAIYNKQSYPLFIKKLRDFGLDDAEDLRGDIDYQALAVFATAAKLI